MVAAMFAFTMVKLPGAGENWTYCSCPRAHARCSAGMQAATAMTTKAATRAAGIERKDRSILTSKGTVGLTRRAKPAPVFHNSPLYRNVLSDSPTIDSASLFAGRCEILIRASRAAFLETEPRFFD